MNDPYALAMLVLCAATVLQLSMQTVWSVRSARAFRQQCVELERLRKRVAAQLMPPNLTELVREQAELFERVESIEKQVGITRWRPPAFESEPAPRTKRTGSN